MWLSAGGSEAAGKRSALGTCRRWLVSKLMMGLPQRKRSVPILAGLVLSAFGALFVYGLWIGARANELLATALQLSTQPHVSQQFAALRRQYGDRFRTVGCAPNGCSYELSVDNRWLAALRLVPYTELAARFDLSRGGHVELMMLDFRVALHGAESPVVHVQTDFCYGGACGGIHMNPWSQSSEQRLSGIVELSHTGTTWQQRRQAYALHVPCLYRLGGCKDIADLLPTVWVRNASGNVACLITNDRGMGDNYETAASLGADATKAEADKESERSPNATIYGKAIDHGGRPAKGLHLQVRPLDVSLSGALPRTQTNDVGEYRFEHLAWWGRYTVYAEDPDAGFSWYAVGPGGDRHPPVVDITAENQQKEFTVYLPLKAGFLYVQLKSQRTGREIAWIQVKMVSAVDPQSELTSTGHPDRVLLIPTDKDILLHVTSDGFREWDESVGRGKLIRMAPGTQRTLAVQLEPLER